MFDKPDPGAKPRAVRPRDAATLILIRRSPARTEVLMGRRSAAHRFMPGKYVFPGGRLDAAILRQLLIALAMIVIMLVRPRGLWPSPEHGKSAARKLEPAPGPGVAR